VKAATAKAAKTPRPPVSSKANHRLRLKPDRTILSPKSQKRNNIFSKLRDIHEGRGVRKLKIKPNTKLLFRVCGLL